jgi:ribosomal protein L36
MLLSRLSSGLSCITVNPTRMLLSQPQAATVTALVSAFASVSDRHKAPAVQQTRLYSAGVINNIVNRQSTLSTSSTQSLSPSYARISQSGGLLNNINVAAIQQTAGLKHKGEPKRRCKHCYFIIKDEVKYVMCTVHPRHKQAQRQVATKYGNMIMTHATQGGRGSGCRGTREMKTQQSFRLDF